MASISRDPNGRKRILFVAPDGKRKTIRLGKMSIRAAEAVKFRIEHLLAGKITGNAVEADTAAWVASLETAMAGKLAAVGLIDSPESKGNNVGQTSGRLPLKTWRRKTIHEDEMAPHSEKPVVVLWFDPSIVESHDWRRQRF